MVLTLSGKLPISAVVINNKSDNKLKLFNIILATFCQPGCKHKQNAQMQTRGVDCLVVFFFPFILNKDGGGGGIKQALIYSSYKGCVLNMSSSF